MNYHLKITQQQPVADATEAQQDAQAGSLGGLTVDCRTGRVSAMPSASFNMADLDVGAGLLASARTTRVTDMSTVVCPEIGQRMHVGTAVVLGLLERDGNGGYRETGATLRTAAPPRGRDNGGGSPQGGAPAAPAAPAVPARPYEAALGSEAADAYAKVSQSPLMMRAVEDTIAGRNVNDIEAARGTGMSGEEFRTARLTLTGALQKQADGAINAMGADHQQFYAVAKQRWPRELESAMREHCHSADATVFAELVDKYLREVPPDAATLADAGYRTWKDPRTGEDMVEIRRGMAVETVSVAVAARAGLL